VLQPARVQQRRPGVTGHVAVPVLEPVGRRAGLGGHLPGRVRDDGEEVRGGLATDIALHPADVLRGDGPVRVRAPFEQVVDTLPAVGVGVALAVRDVERRVVGRPLVGRRQVVGVPDLGDRVVVVERRPVRPAVRLEAGPLHPRGRPVEHAVPRDAPVPHPPDRVAPGEPEVGAAVEVRGDEVLRRRVEPAQRVAHLVDIRRAVQLVDGHGLAGVAEPDPGDGHARLPLRRLPREERPVDRPSDTDRPVAPVLHRDGLVVGLELTGLTLVPVGVRRGPVVAVEVGLVGADVGEAPRDVLVRADDDRRDAGEGDAADVHRVVAGTAHPEVLLVPDRRDGEREVRVVRDDGVPVVGVPPADDPGVRPQAGPGLVRPERLVQPLQSGSVARDEFGSRLAEPVTLAAGRRVHDGLVVVEPVGIERRHLVGAPGERPPNGPPAEVPKVAGQLPGDELPDDERVPWGPARRLVVVGAELERRRARVDVAVDAGAVRADAVTGFGVADAPPGGVGRVREPHLPVEPVGLDGPGAEGRREVPGHQPALEVHLEQPVARLDVADRERQRLPVGGVDVRHARGVVPDRGVSVRVLDLPRAAEVGHPRRDRPVVGAVGRAPGLARGRRRQRQQGAPADRRRQQHRQTEDRGDRTREIGGHTAGGRSAPE